MAPIVLYAQCYDNILNHHGEVFETHQKVFLRLNSISNQIEELNSYTLQINMTERN